MVTYKLIAMHYAPPGIVKKNNSLEFIIEGYENFKESFIYTWPTFPNRYHPILGSSDQTQPLTKWRVGPNLDFAICIITYNLMYKYTFHGIHTNGIMSITIMD